VPGSVLYEDILAGRFTELSPGEILLEERLLLECIEVNNCLFVGNNISNTVPLFGFLQEQKKELCGILDSVLASVDIRQVKKKEFNHL
jgi:hypothetical protein